MISGNRKFSTFICTVIRSSKRNCLNITGDPEQRILGRAGAPLRMSQAFEKFNWVDHTEVIPICAGAVSRSPAQAVAIILSPFSSFGFEHESSAHGAVT